MEYNQFRSLMNLQGIRSPESLTQLSAFIEEFPYCQTSRLLFAKALHEQNSIHYDKALKQAAAYAVNREVLRVLIGKEISEAEFEFPLRTHSENEESETKPSETVTTIADDVTVPFASESFEEWYSEEEISGKAFEDQKALEKIEDPHDVIRKRLEEILGSHTNDVGPLSSSETSDKPPVISPETGETVIAKESTTIDTLSLAENTPVADPEETVYKEEIRDEKRPYDESLYPLDEKSEQEKSILIEAGKTMDVLQRMELEHAMEESILASLEKLPVLKEEETIEKEPEIKEKPVSKELPATEVIEQKQEAEPASTFLQEKESSLSFTGWLRALRNAPAGFEELNQGNAVPVYKQAFGADDSGSEFDETDSLLSDDEIIEKFIREEPKIGPSRSEFYSPVNQAKKSVMDHEDVVSETLANIYLTQKNFQKARWCYQKLSLLYPEKSTTFAALLKQIPDQE